MIAPRGTASAAALTTETAIEFLLRSAQSDPNVQLLPWLEREFTLFAMKADEIDLVTSSFYAAPSSKESRTASGSRARIELTS